ncbi:MAG: outer membrane protein assembly factor BamE [Rubrivivax sp.]|nr:outer membrane protein assembly factor BamE [Rubrivivax sp.]
MSVLRAVSRICLPIAIVAATPWLGGCASRMEASGRFLGFITPYRIDIVQGNVVTSEQIALLRPGMTRAQVRDVLGTPLLTDLFNENRWDYVFTIRRPGTEPQRRAVVVRFDGERMVSVDATELPTEVEFVASISRDRTLRVPKLELTEDERRALPVPQRPPAQAAAEPSGPVRDYPPLEP